MGVKIILKNYPLKRYRNIFPVDIHSLQNRNLIEQKISVMYAEVKNTWKGFVNL